MLQTSTNIYQEPGLIKAAVEMRGKFWEPVPVEEFFDKFLDVKPPPLPDVHHEEFAAVAALEAEMDMHGPLVRRFFIIQSRNSATQEYRSPHSSPFVKASHLKTRRLWWIRTQASS